jgi:raffinose/stachyose/melibiose transport system substrate-binding protein
MKKLLICVLAVCVAAGAFAQAKVLKVWHYESADGAMGIAWAEAMKQFEATHPGVKVQYENKGFEQIRQTAGMILNSDDVPDVMEYNKGNASAGLLSTQGLLTDLTPVAQKRGWDKILSPSLQVTSRYNDKGIMGSGHWYGVTNYGEYVMVYYNKDLFKKVGAKIPTSLAGLEAVADKFVKAGIVPLAIGGAEYPAQHVFYSLALANADKKFLNAYELYQGKFSFTGPEFTFAAKKLVDWNQKGYLGKDIAGQKAESMGLAFEGGKVAMMVSGSWWFGRLQNEIKDFEWGTFLFPGKFSPGSGGNLWVVPQNAKNKDLAYDFIDITLHKDVQTLLGTSGGIPVNADPAKITDPKTKELIQNYSTLLAKDALGFYPDWPAAGFYDTLVSGVQDLLLDKPIPGVLSALDKAYNENKPQ